MKCNCGNCKNHDPDNSYCPLYPDEEKYEEDSCDDGWEDEVELTDDEKREITGDRKAHEIMEQEGRIE